MFLCGIFFYNKNFVPLIDLSW